MREGSLDLEWNTINIPAGQRIVTAFLYINEMNADSASDKNLISQWDVATDKPVVVTRGKDLFPGRVFVSYKPNTYVMTLKNLQYNDTGSFLLAVAVGTSGAAIKENGNAVITISRITGEHGFFIFSVPVRHLVMKSLW